MMDERRRGAPQQTGERPMIIAEPEKFLERDWVPDLIREEEDSEKKKILLDFFIKKVLRMHIRLEEQKKQRGKQDPAAFEEALDLHAAALADSALVDALNHYELIQAEKERGRNRLTGLLNGDAVASIFTERMRDSREKPGKGATVVVRMDADRFKSINDTFGHKIGDGVLKGIAKALEDGVRPSDYALHFSGDEFGLLLTNVKPAEGKTLEQTVEDIIKRLIQKLEKVVRPDGQIQTASVGYRVVNQDEHGFFPQFDHDADEAAGIAKMLQFVPGSEMGSERIVNFDRIADAMEQVSPQEFHASKFQAAAKRPIDEVKRALQIDEAELQRRVAAVLELIQNAEAA